MTEMAGPSDIRPWINKRFASVHHHDENKKNTSIKDTTSWY